MLRLTGVGLAAALVAAGAAGQGPKAREEAAKHPRLGFARIGHGATLGVRLEDVGHDDVARLKLAAERGAIVVEVEPDSPAAAAGIGKDDVIVGFDGETVRSVAQLARLVRETPPGREVAVEVRRDGAVRKLQAILGPPEGRRFAFDFELPQVDLPELRGLGRGLPGPGGFAWDHLRPPRLGIRYQEISGQLARYFKAPGDRAVLVTDVDEGRPAAAAGIRAGDVILKLDGRTIDDGDDLREAVGAVESGKKVVVTVQREGKAVDLEVQLPGDEGESEGREV
jgi:serine protease Do